MPMLRDYVPKCNEQLRVRDMLRDLFDERSGQELEVVESVTTVERLSDVMTSDNNYSTISVVNMYGVLIGLIPRSFVIVLLEQHAWYEHKVTAKGVPISIAFKTIRDRARQIREASIAMDYRTDVRGASITTTPLVGSGSDLSKNINMIIGAGGSSMNVGV